ncbi:MAG: alanine racemase [Chloroflexi bacterium]|nr:alanine racemase [Chloroflexota bacterium]
MPALPRLAWLEIDLDALASNLATIRALAGPGIPVHPVVKADAYGHGAVPVARALERFGADGLCVAAYDEAAALRDAGIAIPILVLYPIPAAWAEDAARRGIAVTAGDADALERLVARLERGGGAGGSPPLAVHLEVETGLGRGGVAVDEVTAVAARIRAVPRLRLEGLWTHFQASEDAATTAVQVERFEAATDALAAAGVEILRRHVAASGGIVQEGLLAADGVRPGLAIYGLIPDELDDPRVAPSVRAEFQPVMALRARPVRVADLPAGWGISYGPTFRTARPSRIATLPLGYGDGWPRSLSNRAEALVRGRRVPLVGNVAMDAVMADVTDVPGPPLGLDDVFTLIGRDGDESITVAEVARARTTNGWEVVTGMARRLPRVYHAASGPEGVRTLVSGGHG